jgi:hypothetical protein
MLNVGRTPFVAALLTLALSACSAVRSESDSFATLQEAQIAGAIEHGWIPAGLPEKTTDLREAHVPSGTHWGLFSFPPADAAPLRALLAGEITTSPPPCNPPGRFEWWPRMLRSPINVAAAHETGLQFYESRDGRRVFAVNWKQGRCFYWSTS